MSATTQTNPTATSGLAIIKAPFYLTLARRGQYLAVRAAGAGWLEVVTAESSYRMTVTEKDKADRELQREADKLQATRSGREFLRAVRLAVTGEEVAA